MNKRYVHAAALALAVSAALPASASSFVLNFDGIADGANANSDPVTLAHGITFSEAQLIPDADEFGDAIPGSDKWQSVPGASAIVARDPNTFAGGFYGAAPSGLNALDVRDAPVLLTFAAPLDLTQFSVTLDRSSFGNLFPVEVLFLGTDKHVLGSFITDQSVPGFTGMLPAPVFGVKEVLLSTTAYYDDISVSAIPLPAPIIMLGAGIMALGAGRRRVAG